MEATGVEPVSENVTSPESYMLSRAPAVGHYPTTFAARAKSRQETRTASLLVSSPLPDVEQRTSLLCDVAPQPVGEAVGDGYLKIKQRMPSVGWQVLFSQRLRVPRPLHASWLHPFPSKP